MVQLNKVGTKALNSISHRVTLVTFAALVGVPDSNTLVINWHSVCGN
jgi:hypothetical protein